MHANELINAMKVWLEIVQFGLAEHKAIIAGKGIIFGFVATTSVAAVYQVPRDND